MKKLVKRIRVTSKAQPRIDPEFVAKALGAEIVGKRFHNIWTNPTDPSKSPFAKLRKPTKAEMKLAVKKAMSKESQAALEEQLKPYRTPVDPKAYKSNERKTGVKMPTKAQVAKALREIDEEDKKRYGMEIRVVDPEREAIEAENARRAALPPEHPEHVCGMMCDGQDGMSSYCARLREKLFG